MIESDSNNGESGDSDMTIRVAFLMTDVVTLMVVVTM